MTPSTNRQLLDAIALAYDAVSAVERRPDSFSPAKRSALMKGAAEQLRRAWEACGLSQRDLLNHVLQLEDRGRAPDIGGDLEAAGSPAGRPALPAA
jgi:hypothetical protein